MLICWTVLLQVPDPVQLRPDPDGAPLPPVRSLPPSAALSPGRTAPSVPLPGNLPGSLLLLRTPVTASPQSVIFNLPYEPPPWQSRNKQVN